MKLLFVLLFMLTAIWNTFSMYSRANGHSDWQNIPAPDTVKKPEIRVEEAKMGPMNLLEIRDSAVSSEVIGQVLGRAYGELFAFAGSSGLKPGRTIAFYHSSGAPFILDAAIETDSPYTKIPTGRIKVGRIGGGETVIVHYKGPYEQVGTAYAALSKWIEAHHETADGPPFEIYLNDPMTVKDPFELRTDVCRRIK